MIASRLKRGQGGRERARERGRERASEGASEGASERETGRFGVELCGDAAATHEANHALSWAGGGRLLVLHADQLVPDIVIVFQ